LYDVFIISQDNHRFFVAIISQAKKSGFATFAADAISYRNKKAAWQ